MATNDEVKISPPLGWTRCTLSDLVKCSWGNTSLTKKAYLAEGFTAFSASGPDGFVEQFEHQGPGIVLSAIGARCGRCFLADGNWTAIKNTITFTGPRDSLADLKFLYFYLNRSGVWPVRGAGQPFIGLNDARALELPVPPLNEQRRIVAKIEDLTARSQAAKQALDAIPPLLERFRQSVLAAAFRGDLTKQWRQQNPNVEPATELLKRIRQERRHRWEQDYLAQQKAKGKTPKDDKWKEKYQEPEPVDGAGRPELPEGWCWVTVRHLATYQSGATYQSKDFVDQGIQVIRLGNLYKGRFDSSRDPVFLPDEDVKEAERIGPGVILVSQTGTRHKRDYGSFVVIPDYSPPMALNQRVLALRPVGGISPFLLSFAAELGPFREHFFAHETGGVNQGNVGLSGVLDGPVPLPPLAEQRVILDALGQANLILEAADERRNGVALMLERLNQSILAKAFRGELVPQDPNDEPASALLERICQDKADTHRPNSTKRANT